jgi:hypothetical protein
MAARTAGPGWYTDPNAGPARERYWNGDRWTDALRALPERPGWYQHDGQRAYWDGRQWAQLGSASPSDWLVAVLLSVVVPVVGLIVGAVWATRGGEKRTVGTVAIALSVVMMLVIGAALLPAR